MKQLCLTKDMLIAALEGRKSQTRRLSNLSKVNEAPDEATFKGYRQNVIVIKGRHEVFLPGDVPVFHTADGDELLVPPYYLGGEEYYITESFRFDKKWDNMSPKECVQQGVGRNDVDYEIMLDDGFNYPKHTGRRRHPMFLPVVLSRFRVQIKDFWVQRLYDISEEDAEREGVKKGRLLGFGALGEKTYREGFFNRWIELYGVKEFDLNPWVFAYSFILSYKTIDNETIHCW